jgi:hypothetical protein
MGKDSEGSVHGVIEVLSQYLPGGTEENYEIPCSSQPVLAAFSSVFYFLLSVYLMYSFCFLFLLCLYVLPLLLSSFPLLSYFPNIFFLSFFPSIFICLYFSQCLFFPFSKGKSTLVNLPCCLFSPIGGFSRNLVCIF